MPPTVVRLTGQAISRRRPRASRPERGSGQQQAQPDRREREDLPARLRQPAGGLAAHALRRRRRDGRLLARRLLAVRLLLGRLLLAAGSRGRLVLGGARLRNRNRSTAGVLGV